MNDDLFPARMLNEIVYCPRLFWLEHVGGEWEDNADTISGKRTHQRADRHGVAKASKRGVRRLLEGAEAVIARIAPPMERRADGHWPTRTDEESHVSSGATPAGIAFGAPTAWAEPASST